MKPVELAISRLAIEAVIVKTTVLFSQLILSEWRVIGENDVNPSGMQRATIQFVPIGASLAACKCFPVYI